MTTSVVALLLASRTTPATSGEVTNYWPVSDNVPLQPVTGHASYTHTAHITCRLCGAEMEIGLFNDAARQAVADANRPSVRRWLTAAGVIMVVSAIVAWLVFCDVTQAPADPYDTPDSYIPGAIAYSIFTFVCVGIPLWVGLRKLRPVNSEMKEITAPQQYDHDHRFFLWVT